MRISDWSSDVCSSDLLFDNQRLLNFVLKSYGLESEAQYPGKIRKIIESDLTDINSLANRFQDPRYQQLTKDLSVAVFGTVKLTQQSTTTTSSRNTSRPPTSSISTRSEEHTSELQSLMRISYAVFCLKKHKNKKIITITQTLQA